jgi:hypothetical protein
VSGPFVETALDHAIKADKGHEIARILTLICNARGVEGADAADAIGDTMRVAFEYERKGKVWDPEVQSAVHHLGGLLVNVLRVMRRRRAKQNQWTSPLEEEQVASDEASAEVVLIHLQQAQIRVSEVRKSLAAETKMGLRMGILDELRAGAVGHAELATRLKCTVPDIRAGYKRISRWVERQAEQKKAAKAP